ncbi:ribosome-associated translation inhibitor RaiA [Actinotalea sp.]|uniref:ribosome hibernation-promoting factor, HPF/YfiA family n=1 Tax=Actinotalea sp. TaxID=1872145 RepID=UPI002C65867C|nr:ribosome-associated translation inhibitor RaiA [Actinotalea sp.]HQY34846.1 ribosome-associated translation inhibitor RaiA [Actinotalea sp.]HRA49994.1 ribosome-associated translation inhibitor RaiA [Actinotalea sp.]
MEIVVVGRHVEVPERFRRHVTDKLGKVEQLAPRAQRIDVEITHEKNPRQSDLSERVELTVRGKGPVVRAEASADDPYAALDAAVTKLAERLRRARDRRKDHHKDTPPVPTDALPTPMPPPEPAPTPPAPGEAVETPWGDSPVVIREKTHHAQPMTLDDALYEMEMVGHDFFLFIDAETALPSVAYRRRGWSYGVIRLDAPVAAVTSAV